MLELDKIYLGDSLKLMKDISDASVDLVVTDPPYGAAKYKWDKSTLKFQEKWLTECHRVMKQDSTIYFFSAPMKLGRVLPVVEKLFKLKNILVWHHPNLYGAWMTFGKDRFKSTWEAIIYATKGKGDEVAFKGWEMFGTTFDVFIVSAELKAAHPAKKPDSIIRRLIVVSSSPGDLVLDPFCGSGVVCKVSRQLKRKFIGIEKGKEFYQQAIKTMQNTQSDMFANY